MSLPPPKTLVIGGRGFIGRHFLSAYRRFYPETKGTHYKASEDLGLFDLRNPNLNFLELNEEGYKYAMIAAACSKIAACERDQLNTYAFNVEGVLHVAAQCSKYGITPIVFSSDYVFDGNGMLYSEESATAALNEYGRQKIILENKLKEVTSGNYLLLRLSKIYGCMKGDGSLFDEMASSLFHKKAIRAATDQVFSPLMIEDMIRAVFALQNNRVTGLFNICGDEVWSRYELAVKMAQMLNTPLQLVEKIRLDDLNEFFKRPKCTAMSCRKLIENTSIKITPVIESIEIIANQYKQG